MWKVYDSLNFELMKLLFEKSESRFKEKVKKCDLMTNAIRCKKFEIIQYLIDQGVDVHHSFCQAVKDNDRDVARIFIYNNVDPHAAIQIAIDCHHYVILHHFMNKYKDLVYEKMDKYRHKHNLPKYGDVMCAKCGMTRQGAREFNEEYYSRENQFLQRQLLPEELALNKKKVLPIRQPTKSEFDEPCSKMCVSNSENVRRKNRVLIIQRKN